MQYESANDLFVTTRSKRMRPTTVFHEIETKTNYTVRLKLRQTKKVVSRVETTTLVSRP